MYPFIALARFVVPTVALVSLVACGGPTTANGVTVHESGRDRSSVRALARGARETSAEEIGYLPAPREGELPAPAVEIHSHGPARTRIQPTPMIQQASVEAWKTRYPDASRDLGEWVRKYPKAAGFFFQWAVANPDHVEVLTEWAITHRYESLGSFMMTRHGWTTLEALLERDYAPAIEQFLEWCRRAPDASTELAKHTNGLAWAGEHIYQRELGTAAR